MTQLVTLSDLIKRRSLIVNDGYRTKVSELGADGFPVLRVSEIADGYVTPTRADHVRTEFQSKINQKLSLEGDVLLTTKGSVGRRAIMPDLPDRFAYSPQLCFFRILDDTIDNRWLYYWLGSEEFWQQATGVSTQTDMAPYISLRDLRAIKITVPDMDTQASVVDILGSLDDAIASNRRSVALMEEIGAAMLEDILSLDIYGAPQFDSETRLGDLLEVLETGSRPRGGVSVSDEGVVSLGAENVQSAGVSAATRYKRVPADFAQAMRRGKLANEDVLVYKDGGKPGNFVPHVSAFGYGFPVDAATINEHVYRVRARTGVTQALLYWLLRSPWMDQEMRKRGTGVAIPGLNSSNFRDLPVPILSTDVIAQLNERLSPLFAEMLRRGTEVQKLARTRDALLPELLSGRVGIREATPT